MIRWNLRIPTVFDQWSDADLFLSVLESFGGTFNTAVRGLPWVSVTLPEQVDPFALPGVINAEEDTPGMPIDLYGGLVEPMTHGPTEGRVWQTLRVNADLVHQFTRGEGVDVAVLDTGFLNHQEFSGANIATIDVVRSSEDTIDRLPHGARVLGTLASQGIELLGVAPGARYHSIKVMDAERDPSTFDVIVNWGTSVDAANGVMLARDLGADIITMSIVYGPSQTLMDAIIAFVEGGGLFFSPVGNDGTTSVIWEHPASPYTIAVGATDHNDVLADFSNTGTWPDAPDCVAPGELIGCLRFDGIALYSQCSGTSYSTPITAGCFALALSRAPNRWSIAGTAVDPKYNMSLPARVVLARQLLRDNSTSINDSRDRVGYGLVDASGIAQEDTSTPVITSISVSPSSLSLQVGQTRQMSATALFSDGSTQDVTASADWFTSSAGVVDVNVSGLATGVGQGSAEIFCIFNGVQSSSSQVTVTATSVILQSISISPTSALLDIGETLQFSAVGMFSDGSQSDITVSADWFSTSAGVVDIDNAGLAVGRAEGSAEIFCMLDGVESNHVTVTVVDAVIVQPTPDFRRQLGWVLAGVGLLGLVITSRQRGL